MSTIDIGDLQRRTRDVLRSVEAGESFTVMIDGQPVARLVPVQAEGGVSWDQAREIFDQPTDPQWLRELLESKVGIAQGVWGATDEEIEQRIRADRESWERPSS